MHTSSSLFLKEHLRIARVLSGCSQGVFICLSRNCISEPAFWGKKDRWRESMLKEKLCWQLLQHLQNHGSSTVILPVVLSDTVLCCTCFLCHRFVVSDSQRSQSWWQISSCVQEWAVNAMERTCFSRHLQFIKWCPDMLSLSCSGPGHHVLYQSVNLLSCHLTFCPQQTISKLLMVSTSTFFFPKHFFQFPNQHACPRSAFIPEENLIFSRTIFQGTEWLFTWLLF